jgi:DnaK suppressor protein
MADLLVDLNIAELNRDVAEMRAVQQALERLNAGTYGVCLECGEPIPRERLRAVPEATTCVRCVTRTAEAVDTTPSL